MSTAASSIDQSPHAASGDVPASPLGVARAAGVLARPHRVAAASAGVSAGAAPPLAPAALARLRLRLRSVPRRRGVGMRTRWWLEALIVVWLVWVYDAINNFAPLRWGPALAHGRDILGAETSLGIAPERALDQWLAGHHTLGLLVADYYDNAHFLVTLGLLAFLWWRRTDLFRPLRNSLVLINLLGFVVFWLYPVAPPRMLDGFTDIVSSSGAIGSWHDGALASQANQLAAMPSLHIAWAVWCAVAVWRISRRAWARALGAAYPTITAFAVLATGNHYVLDILAGALVAAAALALVALAGRRSVPALRRLRAARTVA
ncbi:MAG TPA: phosphatase PAP2 family protein [Solirubrobacteraceae bacterium]